MTLNQFPYSRNFLTVKISKTVKDFSSCRSQTKAIVFFLVTDCLIDMQIVTVLTDANEIASEKHAYGLCISEKCIKTIRIAGSMHTHHSAVAGTHPFYKIPQHALLTLSGGM